MRIPSLSSLLLASSLCIFVGFNVCFRVVRADDATDSSSSDVDEHVVGAEGDAATRERIIAQVSQDPTTLQRLPSHWRDDIDIVLVAVKKQGRLVRYASPRLRASSLQVARAAVLSDPFALQYLELSLRSNSEIVLLAALTNPFTVVFASDDLKANKSLMLSVVSRSGWVLQSLSPELKKDKEIVIAAVMNNPLALEHVHKDLLDDDQVIHEAVKRDGKTLAFASPRLKDDVDTVLLAVEHSKHGEAFQYAGPRAQNDRRVANVVVQKNGWALKALSESLRCDAEIVLAAVSHNPKALEHACAALRSGATRASRLILRRVASQKPADPVGKDEL